MHKSPDFVTVIEVRRLEGLWHVVRLSVTRTVKKLLEDKNQEKVENKKDLHKGGWMMSNWT